jgi:hypothetical protein
VGVHSYANELAKGAGMMWHKACFNCCQCGKRLEQGMQNDSEGDIW